MFPAKVCGTRLADTQLYVSKVEQGEWRLDLVQLRWWCAALETNLVSFLEEFEGRVTLPPAKRKGKRGGGSSRG